MQAKSTTAATSAPRTASRRPPCGASDIVLICGAAVMATSSCMAGSRAAAVVSGSFIVREGLARVARAQQVHDGQPDDAQVEPERPVLDVIEVALHALVKVRVAPEIVDLRPAGDAGLDEMLLHVAGYLLLEALDELGSLGARPDDRHVAAQRVEELRQFVEARAPQKGAEARRAALVATRPHRTSRRLGVDRHRTEFEYREALAVPCYTLLAKQHGPRRRQLHGDRDQEHQRRG